MASRGLTIRTEGAVALTANVTSAILGLTIVSSSSGILLRRWGVSLLAPRTSAMVMRVELMGEDLLAGEPFIEQRLVYGRRVIDNAFTSNAFRARKKGASSVSGTVVLQELYMSPRQGLLIQDCNYERSIGQGPYIQCRPSITTSVRAFMEYEEL